MTPLAAYLVKQIVSRPKHREHIWREPKNVEHLRESLFDIHCFDITQAVPIILEIAATISCKSLNDPRLDKSESVFQKFAFLPAPKTWIEWKHGSGNRIAVLLEEGKREEAFATFFCREFAQNLGLISTISADYFVWGGEKMIFPNYIVEPANDAGVRLDEQIIKFGHFALTVINTPKIIGRQQFMPNSGLERRLTKGLGVGKFPLHAWTEIKLHVAKPIEIDDGEPHEAHLTGRRALHFVRKHIRIRLGQLEYVSSHWRGDPALGIKQQRYTVMQ